MHALPRKLFRYSLLCLILATATLILQGQRSLADRSITDSVLYFTTTTSSNAIANNTIELAASTADLINIDADVSQLFPTARPVKWLGGNDFAKLGQAYSGMWWASRDNFVQVEWTYFKQLEAASFKMFRRFPVYQPVDWIDFSVTHLSVFWKHFHKKKTHHDAVAFAVIEQHLQDYISQTRPLPIYTDSPTPYTIAVLPYLAPAPEGDHRLPEEALRATLSSLWQMGIGRCVVAVGGRPLQNETQQVESVFDSLQDKIQLRFMELQVIQMVNVDTKFMPKTALQQLQAAMLNQTNAAQWLGTNESRWEFVYFTEPDLILHARPSAMPSFASILRQGNSISAHRFQPLPHEGNFPLYNRTEKILPYNFTNELWYLDPLDDSMSCCDRGKWYASNPSMNYSVPLKNNKACVAGVYEYWWQCGFRRESHKYHNLSAIQELHRHIVNYPFLYVRGGTGFPVIDLHQRICRRQTANCLEESALKDG